MTTIQAILYSSDPAPWHQLARTLGLRPLEGGSEVWTEFTGDGLLGVHRVEADDPLDQKTELHLLLDDLDRSAEQVGAAGFEIRWLELEGVGPLLEVTLDGVRVTASAGARPEHGDLAVMGMWFVRDPAEPRRLLEAFGLRPRIASESGGYLDLAADGGGLVALHTAETANEGAGREPEMTLTFEDSDVDLLAARLSAAGVDAVVHDEAYNRTLTVAAPHGERIWINGPQEDLHGYRRLS